MRTTINIDDDILQAAKDMAHIRQISLGEGVSMLARQGLKGRRTGTRRDQVSGLLVFDTADDALEITLEMVQRAQELEDQEYAKYFRKP